MTDPAGRHPDPALLEKLMRNDLDAAERRRVVRHLVSGCSRCVAITSQLWALGDPPDPSPAEAPAMPAADPGGPGARPAGKPWRQLSRPFRQADTRGPGA